MHSIISHLLVSTPDNGELVSLTFLSVCNRGKIKIRLRENGSKRLRKRVKTPHIRQINAKSVEIRLYSTILLKSDKSRLIRLVTYTAYGILYTGYD